MLTNNSALGKVGLFFEYVRCSIFFSACYAHRIITSSLLEWKTDHEDVIIQFTVIYNFACKLAVIISPKCWAAINVESQILTLFQKFVGAWI